MPGRSNCTVNPGEQDVTVIISLHSGEGQDAEAAHEDRCLREILPSYPALDATVHDQQTESHAAKGPREPQISLEQNDHVPETLLLRLMRQIKYRRVDPKRGYPGGY